MANMGGLSEQSEEDEEKELRQAFTVSQYFSIFKRAPAPSPLQEKKTSLFFTSREGGFKKSCIDGSETHRFINNVRQLALLAPFIYATVR